MLSINNTLLCNTEKLGLTGGLMRGCQMTLGSAKDIENFRVLQCSMQFIFCNFNFLKSNPKIKCLFRGIIFVNGSFQDQFSFKVLIMLKHLYNYARRKLLYSCFPLLEREWRRQKSEYESYIMTLEAKRDTRSRHGPEKQVTI